MTIKTICSVKDCNEVEALGSTYCREHKNAMQRAWRAVNQDKTREYNLTYNQVHEGDTYLSANGYVYYLGFDHPACTATGLTPHHRLILWNKLNGKNVPCAECGGMVFWGRASTDPDAICVDHINEIRYDNRPENLDPVHITCNTKRAAKNRAKRAAALAEVAA